MKLSILCILVLALLWCLAPSHKATAAPGDKTTLTGATFYNVSSSTKPQAKVAGEIRYNGTYTFINISGAGSHTHWRRITNGASF